MQNLFKNSIQIVYNLLASLTYMTILFILNIKKIIFKKEKKVLDFIKKLW